MRATYDDTYVPVSEETPISSEGGFPTSDELRRIDRTLMDISDEGLEPLLRRIAGPLVDSHENDVRLEWTYDDLGRFYASIEDLAETLSFVTEKVEDLRKIRADIIEVLRNEGLMCSAPRQSELGGSEYRPSRSALRKWGYSEADVKLIGRWEPPTEGESDAG